MILKRDIGDHFEREAEKFLRNHGLKTIARNFHCRLGEIDLIMEDGECLVFTEVRYRRQARYGSGAESVTRAKQTRIIHTAQRYLQLQRYRAMQACRFDVISLGHDQGKLTVNWIKNAFTTD